MHEGNETKRILSRKIYSIRKKRRRRKRGIFYTYSLQFCTVPVLRIRQRPITRSNTSALLSSPLLDDPPPCESSNQTQHAQPSETSSSLMQAPPPPPPPCLLPRDRSEKKVCSMRRGPGASGRLTWTLFDSAPAAVLVAKAASNLDA